MYPVLLALSIVAHVSAPALTLEGAVHAGGKHVADAVVWIAVPGSATTGPRKRAVLEQRNLTFSPRILVVEVGTEVEFPNRDRVFHNVFSFRDGKRFDLGLYPTGTSRTILFDRPGLSRLFCNIHPNMASYLLVVDSPHFARTDARGEFRIAGLPAGSFTFHAWRPGAEIVTGLAKVDGNARLEVRWP